jgi:hypothetical protein
MPYQARENVAYSAIYIAHAEALGITTMYGAEFQAEKGVWS